MTKKAGSNFKALLIEDHKVTQRVVEMILKDKGGSVDIAGSGQEALQYFEKEVYDFILLDVGLPDMSGLEVARKIRSSLKIKKSTPILICSAISDKSYQEEALAMGIQDYLVKPISSLKFDAIIKKYSRMNKNETRKILL
jgi:CheY-like chemotaxis protein